MTMYALASVLNQEENKIVHEIWDALEDHCGLKAVKISPIPHFSWFTFNEIDDLPGLEMELFHWALSNGPFSTKVNGLGVFSGDSPVIYLPLVRNPLLTAVHIDLINRIRSYIPVEDGFYDPMDWMPHITLAINDINEENMHCAIERCMQFNLQFDIFIDHIAILYMDENTFGLRKKFDFGTRNQHTTVGGQYK